MERIDQTDRVPLTAGTKETRLSRSAILKTLAVAGVGAGIVAGGALSTPPVPAMADSATIFPSPDDAINFAVRLMYRRFLYRDPSVNEQTFWAQYWRAHGGDLTLAGILDSEEGKKILRAERARLGI
jgi:hypothetical protein